MWMSSIAEGLATLWNEGGTTTISEGGRISRVIFITDVAGVYTSDPKSNVDAELIRCIRVDGDNGALSIERECDGDDDDDDNDGKRGRSEADGMNVTGSSHAHDVTGGLKVRPFFSPKSSLGRFFYILFVVSSIMCAPPVFARYRRSSARR